MRYFNTASPIKSHQHYCLPPLERFVLAEILELIAQERYFVLHAPRQMGKTTYLLALMTYLNQTDRYRCVYFNVEVGQAAREDVDAAMRAILSELTLRASSTLNDSFVASIWQQALTQSGGNGALGFVLTQWAEQSDKPLILLIDEIDSLIGDTLISVLRQLRAGYDKRPGSFPQSIILCGLRDVRDYRLHTNTDKAGHHQWQPVQY